MELPDDVLRLVKEYSMPVTRPDWRTLHKVTFEIYLVDFYYECLKRTRYLNNHPERNTFAHIYRLMRYKNVFNESNYIHVFSQKLND